MINGCQIASLGRMMRKAGNARVEVLCVEAAAELERGLGDMPRVKAVTREFPVQHAQALKHTPLRNGSSMECLKCGKSGAVADQPDGLKLTGDIFRVACKS